MVLEQKSKVKGEVNVPGDKSISHRALLIGGLAQGVTEITGAALSEDTLVTIECLRKLGVGVNILSDDKIRVYGRGMHGLVNPKEPINIANSGTTLRALTGILSAQNFESIIVGEERSLKRSMKRVVDFLKDMGAVIESNSDDYKLPIRIKPATLVGTKLKLKGSGGRLKSALVFASIFAEGETKIVEDIPSRNHTEQMLNYFGAGITTEKTTTIIPKVEELYAKPIYVPGDISYATYFILAGVLIPDSEIIVKNVTVNPTRMNIINILKKMGANIVIENERELNNELVGDIKSTYSKLHSINVKEDELEGYVEEMPVVMLAMTQADGVSTLKVSKNVLEKENNRIKHMSLELAKMGAKVTALNNGVEIEGGRPLKGTVIETYGDERIAMPMGIAALIASGETMIKKVQCVDVTFADYFNILCDL